MAHGMHLGDRVEFVTDSFALMGAPRGTVGVIVDDWADGSKDVEVSDPETGEVIAHVRAAEDEIRPYSGPFTVKEPREHGIFFGRGEELDADVEEPPMPDRWRAIQMPGYTTASMAFSEPPEDEVELSGDIPWELREEPPTGPIFH
ncbi:MAG: hypothetical protein QOF79_414 [Actinomycetota bacterium]|nr:hypothetical protein [Actinomycetota bacterium]